MKKQFRKSNAVAAWLCAILVGSAFLASCSTEENALNGSGNGVLKINSAIINDNGEESIERAQSQPETVVEPLDDKLVLTYSLTPEVLPKTKATTPMTSGVYRMVAYSGSNVAGKALFTAGQEATATPLTLAPGSYTFVFYSLNNGTDPGEPDASGNISVAAGADLLWYQTTGTVTSGNTTLVDVTFKHKFSQVKAVVKAPAGQTVTAVSANVAPSYAATLAVLTGALTKVGSSSTVNLTFPTLSTNSVTSNASVIYSAAESPLTFTLASLTLSGGATATNKSLTFNKVLSEGKTYTMNVNITSPSTLPTGSGSLSGRTCFDIALSNDGVTPCGLLTRRANFKADFTQAATNTQTYTFTPSGTVSNVRFMYVNTNGQVITSLAGGNTGNNITSAVTATVNYNTNLNSLALGLTTSNALTADIYVVYNDGATNNGTDRKLKLTAKVKDCVCCGAYVASGVFKEFMCHNLGADQTADPFTGSYKINGAYWQWGNLNYSVGNPTDATGAVPAYTWNANNYSASATAWNSGTEAAPIKSSNDPCPAGYRVPTKTEWAGACANNAYTYAGTYAENNTNFSYMFYFAPGGTIALPLPFAGRREYNTGSNAYRGAWFHYWSSTFYGFNGATYSSWHLYSSGSSNAVVNTQANLYGQSIRCIAE